MKNIFPVLEVSFNLKNFNILSKLWENSIRVSQLVLFQCCSLFSKLFFWLHKQSRYKEDFGIELSIPANQDWSDEWKGSLQTTNVT